MLGLEGDVEGLICYINEWKYFLEEIVFLIFVCRY